MSGSDESWSVFKKNCGELCEAIGYVLQHNTDQELLIDVIKGGAKSLTRLWLKAALQGWYVGTVATLASITSIEKGGSALDEFMLQHLDRNFHKFSERVFAHYPSRTDILRTAFDLHQQGVYVASIPLLLAQADGICAESPSEKSC